MRISYLTCCGLAILLFGSLFAGVYFSVSIPHIKESYEPKISSIPTFFSHQIDSCSTNCLNAPLFDSVVNKKVQLLCNLGLSRHCIRRSPVEEQERFYAIHPISTINQKHNDQVYSNHLNFKRYCEVLGINFVQIEQIFPYQEFKVTRSGREPFDIQISTNDIYHSRENLLNVAAKKLPLDAEYIFWIDDLVLFDDSYIFQQTIVQLEKANIVVPFSIMKFKDKNNKTQFEKEYPYAYQAFYLTNPNDANSFNGFSFVIKKPIYDQLEGLPDFCLLDTCKNYFNLALTNRRNISVEPWVEEWINRAQKILEGSYIYIDSTAIYFDTKKILDSRKSIASKSFDPIYNMQKDENGTLSFSKSFEIVYDLWKLRFSL